MNEPLVTYFYKYDDFILVKTDRLSPNPRLYMINNKEYISSPIDKNLIKNSSLRHIWKHYPSDKSMYWLDYQEMLNHKCGIDCGE